MTVRVRNSGFNGPALLDTNKDELVKGVGLRLGPAKNVARIVAQINDQKQNIQENKYLKYEILLLRLGNTQSSASVYRFVREGEEFKIWEIEEDPDIMPQEGIGHYVFNNHPEVPAQGSNEISITQPFCKNVVSEINDSVNSMKLFNLHVYGDGGSRLKDQVYADIIIGPADFHKELTDNPPDLSKGLGWEVKNNLSEGVKVCKGKGQLIKYARAYLTASSRLTNVFYGRLTDGKIWQFVKIQLILDIDDLKVMFEESPNYEWSIKTASLIAGIIERYHDDLSMRASGEKKESQNNDKTYMYRNRPSVSSETLLASLIEEGVYIRLFSGNSIHVQIKSYLGAGRECIVFLAQVRDYGIMDAVLKIEVRRKHSKISQVYREISALHALGDLRCVPTILFEGFLLVKNSANYNICLLKIKRLLLMKLQMFDEAQNHTGILKRTKKKKKILKGSRTLSGIAGTSGKII
ncbi:hypothetical protein RhiirA4_517042 [Rhizophagus irregularis]|uniref:Uncharacterized protein n=1 Tax=Rhizophagus irregularis TaxID=588596 RepID=A0A2I1HMD7_9GLOM|nr:hypothetical protein RhiirA4_517042 [Rhizophagus irregularis]